ncbi:MAG: hypothetical protein JRF40_01240 [Deltaproteobacteria bacterium]|nr:hypothetical protein [Deltaproteobacteria bacterium]MBW2218106.1 hypothetical protein [Deltaproteobacteria bacterium]
MRGVFFIVILITMLIVAFLVMKNIESAPVENGVDKMEMIDMAKDAAKDAEKAADLLKKRAGEAMP